jgi:hypothetical protein
VISSGLSPSQIYSVNLDPATGNVASTQGSPYWGDYAMAGPFWLTGDQSLLFTAAGTYFNNGNLNYIGTFSLPSGVLAMSHSSVTQEAVVLPGNGAYIGWSSTAYPAAYKRFTGSLLFPAADVPLPLVAGMQSYGLAIFHTANGSRHVLVVQTGTNQTNGVGAQYFVILR